MLLRVPVTDARVRRAAVLAAAVIGATPIAATAAPRHDGTPTRIAAAPVGVVYGGVTDDGFGLMVETNRSRRQIVRMATGLTLRCTSGAALTIPDGWRRLAVRKGRFRGAFGPSTQRNPDGTTTDLEGAVSGRFNRSKTTITGTWSFKATEHDAAGAVTDTCESGDVDWSAKQ